LCNPLAFIILLGICKWLHYLSVQWVCSCFMFIFIKRCLLACFSDWHAIYLCYSYNNRTTFQLTQSVARISQRKLSPLSMTVIASCVDSWHNVALTRNDTEQTVDDAGVQRCRHVDKTATRWQRRRRSTRRRQRSSPTHYSCTSMKTTTSSLRAPSRLPPSTSTCSTQRHRGLVGHSAVLSARVAFLLWQCIHQSCISECFDC